MNNKSQNVIVIIVFIGLALLFFHRFLDGTNIFGFKDLSRYFYPLRHYMIDEVKSGRLPLWNPYLFCGYPFLATLQINIFYPLTLLYFMLPFNLAFNYYTILHYFLASFFVYLLLRHYGVSKAGAALSGIIFAFSGYLLSVANMNTTLSSVTWLPLIVLFYDKLIKKFSKIHIIILGVLMGIMFLGGEPTIIYMTTLILIAYGLVFGRGLVPKLINIISILLIGVVSLLITAIQLFPSIELALLSDRLVQNGFRIVSMRSLPVRETINIMLPYFFGNLTNPGSYNQAFLGELMQDWLLSPYIGFIPLFFALYALRKNRREIRFWIGSAILGLLLAFGAYTPIYTILYKIIPGISFIRYPVKFFFITSFSIAVLAGLGFDTFFGYSSHRRSIRALWGLAASVLLIFLILQIFKTNIFETLISILSKAPDHFLKQQLWSNLEFSIQSVLNLGVFIGIFALILSLLHFNQISLNVAVFTILLIVVVDLYSVNASINIPVKSQVFKEKPPNLSLLLSDTSLFRYVLTGKMIKHNQRLYGSDYNKAVLEAKDKFVANQPLQFRLYDFDGYESIHLGDYREFNMQLDKLSIDERIKLLATLNVKYIVSLVPLESEEIKLLKQSSNYFAGQCYIYLIKNWMPRAYMLNQPNEKINILKYGPSYILIEAEIDESGTLFLSDSYYPGWKAYVNGEESSILKTKYRYRGVKVKPGKHTIEFVYDPATFKSGAILSIFTVLGIFLLGLQTAYDRIKGASK